MYVFELKKLIKFVQFFNIAYLCYLAFVNLCYKLSKNAKISFNLKIFIVALLTKPTTD